MPSSSRPTGAVELSPTVTLALVVTFVGAGGLGYLWFGIAGAFFGAIGATFAAAAIWVLARERAADRTRVGAVPDVRNLPPAQALSVMGALVEGASFRSELLAELEGIDPQIDNDPAAALEALDVLAKQHPRSPAVFERIAKAHLARDDRTSAAQAASKALVSALDGGMNPMAARVFESFESLHDDLDLTQAHRTKLDKARRAQGAPVP